MSAVSYRRTWRPQSAAEYAAAIGPADSINSAASTTEASEVATGSGVDNDVESEVSESTAVSSAAKLQETDMDDEENLESEDVVNELRDIRVDRRVLPNRSKTMVRKYDRVVDEFEGMNVVRCHYDYGMQDSCGNCN